MRALTTVGVSCALIVGLSVVASAHVGPTFLAQQVDPKTITIDGTGDDPGWSALWDDVNTITRDKLGGGVILPAKDDWDTILKVGWSAPPDNMLYIYNKVTDNMLNDDASTNGGSWQDDALEIYVDANHDGGRYDGDDVNVKATADGRIAQQYAIRMKAGLPPGPASGDEGATNTPYFIFAPMAVAWQSGPPWFEAAIEPPVGRTNITYAYEAKLAMWDLAGETPEASQRHMNAAGQTIGLAFQWDDIDATVGFDSDFIRFGVDSDFIRTQGSSNNPWRDASQFGDFVLVEGPTHVTAVEATSWGAIKATFQR
ncbi:MAG: hypothetical protein HY709_10390 [Candidatus Latescibacteria bacterium]|nr:hypothetical protein [Candidatus Latescibacterota bacterium]